MLPYNRVIGSCWKILSPCLLSEHSFCEHVQHFLLLLTILLDHIV